MFQGVSVFRAGVLHKDGAVDDYPPLGPVLPLHCSC